MTRPVDPGDRPVAAPAGSRADAALRREARLGAALRANLRRRKDQQRERGKPDTPVEEPPRPEDPGGEVL